MKIRLFYCIAFIFVFNGCIRAELDNMQAFEYTFPELGVVDPLPEIVLTEPVEVVETDGKIIVTKESDELVQDVVVAVIDDSITQENLDVIQSFSELAPNVSDEVIIDGVTEAWILGVLDGSILPSPEFLQIESEFEEIEELLKYYSQLEFPTVDGFVPGRRLMFSKENRGNNVANLRIESLVTPCKKAAEAIYLKNVGLLEDQSDLQIKEIEDHYQVFIDQYEQDYLERLISGQQVIADNTTQLLEFVLLFNKSIDGLDYPNWVKRGLKIYVIAFVLRYNAQIIQLEESFAIAAKFARDKRIATANGLRDEAIQKGEAYLKVAILTQTTKYNTATNNCHNQGAGA
jgi:hypothetical protein